MYFKVQHRMTCFRYNSLWHTDITTYRQSFYRPAWLSPAPGSNIAIGKFVDNFAEFVAVVLAGNKNTKNFLPSKHGKALSPRIFPPKRRIDFFTEFRPWELQILYIFTLRLWKNSHFLVSKLDSFQIMLNQSFCHTWDHPVFSNLPACLQLFYEGQ